MELKQLKIFYSLAQELNFTRVAKKIGYIPNIGKIFVKPFISALLCAGAAYGSYELLGAVLPVSSKLITIIAIAVAVVVYLVAIFAIKALTRDDILLLPKGEKIARVLEKRKLI